MAKPNEILAEMFESFLKLINDLQVYGKVYRRKEFNMKFLFTLIDHLEHKNIRH